jgi:protein-S-isoprenylcysteine O-methyltransferase Ste14
MMSNAFFSTVVRIQTDRGQTVSRAGPYRYVRHPGYLGAVVQSLAIPFLLGSWWSLIPGIAAAALMVIRTRFEDQALQAELNGYSDFAKQVRYRLVPGIW